MKKDQIWTAKSKTWFDWQSLKKRHDAPLPRVLAAFFYPRKMFLCISSSVVGYWYSNTTISLSSFRRFNHDSLSNLLPSEWTTLCQSSLATCGLAQDLRASCADDDGLGVWKDGCDGEAAGALDVHEETTGCGYQSLSLSLTLFIDQLFETRDIPWACAFLLPQRELGSEDQPREPIPSQVSLFPPFKHSKCGNISQWEPMFSTMLRAAPVKEVYPQSRADTPPWEFSIPFCLNYSK
jgi:hypothetical protein